VRKNDDLWDYCIKTNAKVKTKERKDKTKGRRQRRSREYAPSIARDLANPMHGVGVVPLILRRSPRPGAAPASQKSQNARAAPHPPPSPSTRHPSPARHPLSLAVAPLPLRHPHPHRRTQTPGPRHSQNTLRIHLPHPPAARASSATPNGRPTKQTKRFGAAACAYPFVGARRYTPVGVMVLG
jgi:hypothetical protein